MYVEQKHHHYVPLCWENLGPFTNCHYINFVATVLLSKVATLQSESEKCCRVTNQIVYHNTFDLLVATDYNPVTVEFTLQL